MVKKYDFKRDIFFELSDALNESPIVFLYGARNTGKTICLKQLSEAIPDAEYCDVKSTENLNVYRLAHEIEDCITSRTHRTFLIDNIGYCPQCDSVINGFEYAFDELGEDERSGTRIVLAGGPPAAMRYWARKYFGEDARQFVLDFPSYSEWLRFNSVGDSPENRERFLFEKSGLTEDFVSFDGFLSGCLAESEVVNSNAMNIIFGNECDELNLHILKNILYGVLAGELGAERESEFKDNAVISRHLNAFSFLSPDTLRQGDGFLRQWGIITQNKSFKNAPARIAHPFIRMQLLKEAFDEIPPEIKRAAERCYF